MFVFRSVRRIVVFLELVFTPMAIDKKKCSLSADCIQDDLTCIQDDLRFRSFTIAR